MAVQERTVDFEKAPGMAGATLCEAFQISAERCG